MNHHSDQPKPTTGETRRLMTQVTHTNKHGDVSVHYEPVKPTTGAPDCLLCGRPPHPDSYGHSYRPREPKTTGEWWTEQDVDGYWHIGVGNRGFAELDEVTAKAIADAHNTALDEAVDAAEQEILILRQQLTAEREKFTDSAVQYEALEREVQQLRYGRQRTSMTLEEMSDQPKPTGLRDYHDEPRPYDGSQPKEPMTLEQAKEIINMLMDALKDIATPDKFGEYDAVSMAAVAKVTLAKVKEGK